VTRDRAYDYLPTTQQTESSKIQHTEYALTQQSKTAQHTESSKIACVQQLTFLFLLLGSQRDVLNAPANEDKNAVLWRAVECLRHSLYLPVHALAAPLAPVTSAATASSPKAKPAHVPG